VSWDNDREICVSHDGMNNFFNQHTTSTKEHDVARRRSHRLDRRTPCSSPTTSRRSSSAATSPGTRRRSGKCDPASSSWYHFRRSSRPRPRPRRCGAMRCTARVEVDRHRDIRRLTRRPVKARNARGVAVLTTGPVVGVHRGVGIAGARKRHVAVNVPASSSSRSTSYRCRTRR